MVSVSKDNPYRSTIQNEVDYWLHKDRHEQHNFAVFDKIGPCEVPRSVSIRFYRDEFIGFKAIKGNNNFYFKGCSFGDYFVMTEGTAIFESCVFSTPPDFISCKIDFVGGNKFNETVYLSEKTFAKSNGNHYEFPKVYSLSKNSRLESYNDKYYSPAILYAAKENCFIKSVGAEFIGGLNGPAFLAVDNCTLHLSDTDIQEAGPPLFDMKDSCSLQVFNIKEINVTQKVLVQSNKCKSVFKNIPKIQANIDIYNSDNSDLAVLNVIESTAQNDFFMNINGGNYSFKYFDKIQANNIGFNIDGGIFNIASKSDSEIITQKEVIKTGGLPSNITVCVLNKIESTSEACANVTNSYINLSQIKTVLGSKEAIKATNKSYVRTNQITDLLGKSSDSVLVTTQSTFIGSNIVNIKSDSISAIEAQDKSVINIQNCSKVLGILAGINSYNSKVIIKEVSSITGNTIGVSLTNSDLHYDVSLHGGLITGGNGGIAADTTSEGANKLFLVGPATVTGSAALYNNNCYVEDYNITWSGDVISDNSVWNSLYAKGNNFSTNNSSVFATATKFKKINPENSFITLNRSSFSSLHEKTSTLFGGQTTGTIYFNSDDSYTSIKGFFATAGDLGLQADNSILLRSNKIEGSIREDIRFDSRNTATFSSTGALCVSGDNIGIKSNINIKLEVSPSSIIIDATKIISKATIVQDISGA